MSKRPSYAIKEKILLSVKEKPATYASLERKINTGYRTIKANCEELEKYSQVKIEIILNRANGRPSNVVSITEKGLETIQKKKSKKQ